MTDWMAAKIISKGWAEKIDPTNVPNCVANLRDAAARTRSWDAEPTTTTTRGSPG